MVLAGKTCQTRLSFNSPLEGFYVMIELQSELIAYGSEEYAVVAVF